MTWNIFPYIVGGTIGLWSAGVGLSLFSPKAKLANLFSKLAYLAGSLVVITFVVMLWQTLDRPPMRTLGETRLWYAVFLPVVGFAVHYRWGIKWLNIYCVALASMFLCINLMNPETYDKALMPALQSIWFVPHVIVYMISYALLAASSLVGFHGVFLSYKQRPINGTLRLADQIVTLGYGFLTTGLLFGALWAKEAWGHYWTWDPKETWAFLTWIAYLVFLHIRHHHKQSQKLALQYLAFSFIVLLVCWFGVNYLPSASYSVHTYTN